MYNNQYRNYHKEEEEEQEWLYPHKKISIVKSSHTRNNNNNHIPQQQSINEDSNNTFHNYNYNKKIISSCIVDKESHERRYVSKEKPLQFPTKQLVQNMILNSNKINQISARIKANFSKAKNSIPIQSYRHKPLIKPSNNSNGIRVKSIDFDKIGLDKTQESKSRNLYSQRESNSININSSFIRGHSNEKQSIKKTIDYYSRNKMCPVGIINQRTTYSRNKNCSENSNREEIQYTNGQIAPSTNSKRNIHHTMTNTNYLQKYLQKHIKNSYDISKRVQEVPQFSNRGYVRKMNN